MQIMETRCKSGSPYNRRANRFRTKRRRRRPGHVRRGEMRPWPKRNGSKIVKGELNSRPFATRCGSGITMTPALMTRTCRDPFRSSPNS